MNYWIFKFNSEKYKLNERLKDQDPETSWRITRFKYEIHIDDIVLYGEQEKIAVFVLW